jgi:hypothetical protein
MLVDAVGAIGLMVERIDTHRRISDRAGQKFPAPFASPETAAGSITVPF